MSHVTWKLGKVVVNTARLETMIDFYQNIMGMTVLDEKEHSVLLGVESSNFALVELRSTPEATKNREAGLFHLAVLLPSRSDLGEFLYHLLVQRYPLQGASDHGYSEAIYFTDPDGNGIEVYADKPESDWDRRENGRIEGVTEPMDVDGVIQSVKKPFDGLPAGTIMGHVHLSVRNLASARTFYETVLGLGLKSTYFGQANFLSTGDYHHQIGTNTWAGSDLAMTNGHSIGLHSFEWVLPTETDYQKLKKRLKENQWPFEETENVLLVRDDSGITQLLHVEK